VLKSVCWNTQVDQKQWFTVEQSLYTVYAFKATLEHGAFDTNSTYTWTIDIPCE